MPRDRGVGHCTTGRPRHSRSLILVMRIGISSVFDGVAVLRGRRCDVIRHLTDDGYKPRWFAVKAKQIGNHDDVSMAGLSGTTAYDRAIDLRDDACAE